MPPSRYIRESIGRLRRPRVQPRAEAPSSLRQRVLVTPGRPPPCPAPSFPPAFDTAVDPPLPLRSCCIPNAPVSTLDLSIRERTCTVNGSIGGFAWIRFQERDGEKRYGCVFEIILGNLNKLRLDISILKCAYVVYVVYGAFWRLMKIIYDIGSYMDRNDVEKILGNRMYWNVRVFDFVPFILMN